MDIRPFTIDIPQSEIDDLNARLGATRWPNVADVNAAEEGVSIAWLRDTSEQWRTSFDWRAAEAELNELPQFTADTGEFQLHFVHARAEGDGIPVMLIHGWPDSFLRYRAVVPLLVSAGHDVVVPSLPGFAFSGQPGGPVTIASVTEQLHTLATSLGYERYAVSGGDWGSVIADAIASAHPDAIVALHLTDVPFTKSFAVDRSGLTEAEQQYFAQAEAWSKGASYFAIQAAAPTTLSVGLTDSPAALLAWFAGKIRQWSDEEPDVTELLTQASVHWFTGDARSSMRLYSEGFGVSDASSWSDDDSWGDAEASGDAGASDDADGGGAWSDTAGESAAWADSGTRTPAGLTFFGSDFVTAPREYAERFYDVRRYTVTPSGGHFCPIS